MTTKHLATLAEYGASHGVSKQAAAKWKARGYLVFAGELVDVEASDKRMQSAGKGRFNRSAHVVRARSRRASTVNQEGRQVVDRQPGPSTDNPQCQPPPSTSAEDDDALPSGGEYRFADGSADHLTDPHDVAAVALLPLTVPAIGVAAALAAHGLGMSAELAEQLGRQVRTSALETVALILDEAGVPPPPGRASWEDVGLALDRVPPLGVDWSAIAHSGAAATASGSLRS